MKVLLQHKETGLYLKEPGVTTPSASDAMDFMCSTKAIDYCSANRIHGMQIVLRFAEEHYDIVLPVLKDRRASHTHAARAA